MYKFEMTQVLDECFLTRLVEKFRVREVRFYDKLDLKCYNKVVTEVANKI